MSAAGSTAPSSPLMIGIALWIKLDSNGPVFFRQDVGSKGRGQFLVPLLMFEVDFTVQIILPLSIRRRCQKSHLPQAYR